MPLLTLKTHTNPQTFRINLDANTLERLKVTAPPSSMNALANH